MKPITLRRWVDRQGKIVCWGNMVMGYRGQEFEEIFATEEEAIERECQAKAGEGIGEKRSPVAIKRSRLH